MISAAITLTVFAFFIGCTCTNIEDQWVYSLALSVGYGCCISAGVIGWVAT